MALLSVDRDQCGAITEGKIDMKLAGENNIQGATVTHFSKFHRLIRLIFYQDKDVSMTPWESWFCSHLNTNVYMKCGNRINSFIFKV